MTSALGKRAREPFFAVPLDRSTRAFIEANNEAHPSAHRLHLIWPACDDNYFFSPQSYLNIETLRALSQRYVITMDQVVDEDFEGALLRSQEIDRLGTLVLMGHGSPDGKILQISRDKEVDLTQLSKRAIAAIRQAAHTVLLSCYLGLEAAPHLASCTGRSIVASREAIAQVQEHEGQLILRGCIGQPVGVFCTPDTCRPIPLPAGFVPNPHHELLLRAFIIYNRLSLSDLYELNDLGCKGEFRAASLALLHASDGKVKLANERCAWWLAQLGKSEAWRYFLEFPPPLERCEELLALLAPYTSPLADSLKDLLKYLPLSKDDPELSKVFHSWFKDSALS